ncbi:MAG: hypothetical protein ACRELX_13540 [Longimicrobiales bacterium]
MEDVIMFRTHTSRYTVVAGLIAVLAGGCDDSTPASPEQQALDELRAAVEPLRDLDAAQQAGYEVLVVHPTNGNECLRDPQMGAMGYHYLNPALADGAVTVAEPEVLIYERQADGSSRFVAVEYLIPFASRGEDEAAPVLFGQEFTQNHTFDVWALHAWVGVDNPSGTFAAYNPDVSCDY